VTKGFPVFPNVITASLLVGAQYDPGILFVGGESVDYYWT